MVLQLNDWSTASGRACELRWRAQESDIVWATMVLRPHLLAFLLLAASPYLAGGQEPARQFNLPVSIEVEAPDTLEALIKSHLAAELRRLPNVLYPEDGVDLVSISALAIYTEGQVPRCRVVALSVASGNFFELPRISSEMGQILTDAGVPVGEQRSRISEGFLGSEFLGRLLASRSPADLYLFRACDVQSLRDRLSELVATIDVDHLEPLREKMTELLAKVDGDRP